MQAIRQVAVVAIAGLGLSGLVGIAPAYASGNTSHGCSPNPRRIVATAGHSYATLGPAAGKYNASSGTGTLSYTLTKTTNRSTTVEAGAKMSTGWGVATVEAHLNVSIAASTGTSTSVSDNLSVPGHYFGYDQAKAEFTRYHVYDVETTATCGTAVTYDYGYLDAITTYPFFSECISRSACTPRP